MNQQQIIPVGKKVIILPFIVFNKEKDEMGMDGGSDDISTGYILQEQVAFIGMWNNEENKTEEFNGEHTVVGLFSGSEYVVPMDVKEVVALIWPEPEYYHTGFSPAKQLGL